MAPGGMVAVTRRVVKQEPGDRVKAEGVGVKPHHEAKRARTDPHPPQQPQPSLPSFRADVAFGALGQEWNPPSLTDRLDKFLSSAPASETREETLLRYLQSLPLKFNNSQLLEAELAYLYFAGDGCPLLYDAGADTWYVYDVFWKTSKYSTARARLFFQTMLLSGIRSVQQMAWERGVFPAVNNGEDGEEEHVRTTFLSKFATQLENREGAERLVREASMFFFKGKMCDRNPDILQLQNCVVDLKTNQVRYGRPSDYCSLSSTVVIPKRWLDDTSVIESESQSLRQRAWDVLWSMFKRDGIHCQVQCFGHASLASLAPGCRIHCQV